MISASAKKANFGRAPCAHTGLNIPAGLVQKSRQGREVISEKLYMIPFKRSWSFIWPVRYIIENFSFLRVFTPWAAEHDSLDSSQMEYHIKRHHHNNTFLANQFDTLQGLVEGMRPLWLGLS